MKLASSAASRVRRRWRDSGTAAGRGNLDADQTAELETERAGAAAGTGSGAELRGDTGAGLRGGLAETKGIEPETACCWLRKPGRRGRTSVTHFCSPPTYMKKNLFFAV